MQRGIIIGSLGLALVAIACAHSSPEPVGSAMITSAGVDSTPIEVRPEYWLASAVCNREAKCGQVGTGGWYDSSAACVRSVGTRAKVQLAGWRCAPAASRARYKECLGALEEEPCSTILDLETRAELCPGNAACGL